MQFTLVQQYKYIYIYIYIPVFSLFLCLSHSFPPSLSSVFLFLSPSLPFSFPLTSYLAPSLTPSTPPFIYTSFPSPSLPSPTSFVPSALSHFLSMLRRPSVASVPTSSFRRRLPRSHEERFCVISGSLASRCFLRHTLS